MEHPWRVNLAGETLTAESRGLPVAGAAWLSCHFGAFPGHWKSLEKGGKATAEWDSACVWWGGRTGRAGAWGESGCARRGAAYKCGGWISGCPRASVEASFSSTPWVSFCALEKRAASPRRTGLREPMNHAAQPGPSSWLRLRPLGLFLLLRFPFSSATYKGSSFSTSSPTLVLLQQEKYF